MKKDAMIYVIKDSLLLLVIGGPIGVGLYYFVLNSYGSNHAEIAFFGMLVISTFFIMNILSAFGRTMLIGGSYHINKEKNSVRVGIFNEDGRSSVLHTWKVIFFFAIGLIFYPFAIIVALMNIKELFTKNEECEELVEEKQKLAERNLSDPKIKGDKKWKIHIDAFTSYYFHTDDEAYIFAKKQNIHPKYVQKAI